MTKKTTTVKPSIIGKTSLVSRIANNIKNQHGISISRDNISMIMDESWEEIARALKAGQEVRWIGYCSIKRVVTKPRMARHLKTNKEILIPSKTLPKIKLSNTFKGKIV